MGHRFATIHIGQKLGDCAPFGGSPSNTMSPRPRPTSLPSAVLIHPTVWSQYTNVTDRQTDRQRSNSTGQTILQSVTQKLKQNSTSKRHAHCLDMALPLHGGRVSSCLGDQWTAGDDVVRCGLAHGLCRWNVIRRLQPDVLRHVTLVLHSSTQHKHTHAWYTAILALVMHAQSTDRAESKAWAVARGKAHGT